MTARQKHQTVRTLLDSLRMRNDWEGRHADQVAVYAVATGEAAAGEVLGHSAAASGI